MELHLDPVTVVAGDNFSGKSSVPMAMRLGLTGYLPPPIGKTAGSIWSLAGDPDKPGTMEVELKTDTGRTSKLVFARNAKGGVSTTGGVPMDMALPGLLVEPLTFFGMTAAQRMQAVFEACDPAKLNITSDALARELDGIQAMPRAAAEETIATCKKDLADRFKALSPQFALAALEETWKECLKASKSNLESQRGLLASVSQLSRERPGWDEARLRELVASSAALQKLAVPCKERVEAETAVRVAEQALRTAESALASAEKDLSDFDDLECCPTCGAKSKGWKDAVLASLKADVKRHSSGYANCEKVLADVREKAKALVAADDARIAKAREEQRKVADEAAEISRKKGEDDAWRKAVAQRDATEKNVLALQAEVEVYKAAVEIVRDARENAVSVAFGGVLKVARGFTDELLNSPLEFVDGKLGRRVSELDKHDGITAAVGSWIGHEGFSGTEQLLAYAGFAVALARQAPIKLVIMDELGRLNMERRVQLLARMRKLVETGVIDQFVGCDVEALDGTAAKYIEL